jgi:hypothetical protein
LLARSSETTASFFVVLAIWYSLHFPARYADHSEERAEPARA